MDAYGVMNHLLLTGKDKMGAIPKGQRYVLIFLPPVSFSQANTLDRNFPQIIGVVIFDLLKLANIRSARKRVGEKEVITACNIVLDVLESIVPSRHSVSAIA